MQFRFENSWREHEAVFFLPCIAWSGEQRELHFAWLVWDLSVEFD